jgi:predicted Zn-dependent peptidase
MRALITILLLAFTALGQPAPTPAKEAPPAPGAPKPFSIPAIRRMELPNGMRVRLVDYGSVPKVAVRLVTLTGNVDEGPNETWLADLTGEMMKQGTKTRASDEIAREVAMMGGSLDVNVGMNQTVVGSDVFSESVVSAIQLIADVARNPRLPESELARLKGDHLRNLSIAKTQPGSLAQEKFAAVLFPNAAYGRVFPTEAMLQGFTIDQVRNFHEKNFGAARSTLYVVGRFDSASAESAIRASYGDWKAGNPQSKITVSPNDKRGIYFIERPGAVQSTLLIGLPTIDATNAEYLPLTVMDALLGGSFGSRITSNIREQKGYTYSPHSVITTRPGGASWAEAADVTTNVTGPAIKEILAEIERLRNEPPTDAELKGIQNYLAGTFVLRNSSRDNIAGQLAFLDLYGLSEDFLRNYVQRVYALTPADVQRLARTYIDPSKLTIVVVGDPAVREQIRPYGELVR